MKYVSMYKKYFISSDSGKSDYEMLINSPSTIIFNIHNNNYPFFVNVNNEILRMVEKIYALNNDIVKITYANKSLPNIALQWIINHTLVEEICMSNEMEGVVSTRKEINDLLSTKETKKYKRLYGMVNKYIQLINEKESLFIKTPEDVRNLYNKTMLKDIQKEDVQNVPDGKIFRKDSVDVKASERIIYTGLNPETKIISTMEEALKILNTDDLSLLIRVAVFHYFFGHIHPFYDGNGRMARFISSIYLSKELDVLSALQVSVSCQHNQKKYYESFKIANDIRNKGDLTYFVISFLEILQSGLESLKLSIEEKNTQYFYYQKLINKLPLSDKHTYALLNVLLQSTLFSVKELTLDDLVEISPLSKSTVKKKIVDPSIQPFLLVDKSNKAFTYSLNLDALSEME